MEGKRIVLEKLRKDWTALKDASEELKNDKEVVLCAVKKDGKALRYASERLQNDKDVVLEALKHCGKTELVFCFSGQDIRGDKDVVLAAVRQNGHSLLYASDYLRSDEEVVLEAVRNRGSSLEFANEALKGNEEIVLEALKEYPNSFRFASLELRNNRNYVIEILRINGLALQHASEELKNDEEIVIEAVKQNFESNRYIGDFIRSRVDNEEFVEFLIRECQKQIDLPKTWMSNLSDTKTRLIWTSSSESPSIFHEKERKKMEEEEEEEEEDIYNVNSVSSLKENEEEEEEGRKVLENPGEKGQLKVLRYIYEKSFILQRFRRTKECIQNLLLLHHLIHHFHLVRHNKSTPNETNCINLLQVAMKEQVIESQVLESLTNLVEEVDWMKGIGKSVVSFTSGGGYFIEKDQLPNIVQLARNNIIKSCSGPIAALFAGTYRGDGSVPFEHSEIIDERTRRKFDHVLRRVVTSLIRTKIKHFLFDFQFGQIDISIHKNNNNNSENAGINNNKPSDNSDSKTDGNVEPVHYIGYRNPLSRLLQGFVLLYHEVSLGRKKNPFALNRKKVCRRVFYGKFFCGNRQGENICQEYSPSDGRLVFSGSYKNDQRHGKGLEYSFVKELGEDEFQVYEGQFKRGRRNGRGESFDPKTGEVKRGVWKNGRLIEKSVYKFDCPVIRYSSIERHLLSSKVIGQGAFGVVYKVKTSLISKLVKKIPKNEKYVALKIVKVDTMYQRKAIFTMAKRGIGLCHSFKSKHVLEIYGLIQGSLELGYIMKLCSRSIDKLISESYFASKKKAQPSQSSSGTTNTDHDSNKYNYNHMLTMKEKRRILHETALGLKAMHGKYVMHRDLKWSNVMIDDQGTVKLTDFDTLKEDEVQWRLQSIQQSSKIGTPGFLAPEVFLGGKFTLKCDVYAFGLMAYALLWERNVPYLTQYQCSCGTSLNSIFVSSSLDYHVANCNLRPLLDPKQVERFPEFIIDIMIQCWDKNPFNRPSIQDICLRFEIEDNIKSFTMIIFQFSYGGLLGKEDDVTKRKNNKNQKMFMSKPYQISKMRKWIRNKFFEEIMFLLKNNQKKKKKEEDEEEMEGEEEEEEVENLSYFPKDESYFLRMMEKKKKKKKKKKKEYYEIVTRFEHSIMGTISKDEELEKIIQRERNPVIRVELNSEFFHGGDEQQKNEETRRIFQKLIMGHQLIADDPRSYEEKYRGLKLEHERMKKELEKMKVENDQQKDTIEQQKLEIMKWKTKNTL